MADDKFDELIQKQVQRENKMKQVREDYINEMGELPKKQITVKLFPNTHKTLKPRPSRNMVRSEVPEPLGATIITSMSAGGTTPVRSFQVMAKP